MRHDSLAESSREVMLMTAWPPLRGNPTAFDPADEPDLGGVVVQHARSSGRRKEHCMNKAIRFVCAIVVSQAFVVSPAVAGLVGPFVVTDDPEHLDVFWTHGPIVSDHGDRARYLSPNWAVTFDVWNDQWSSIEDPNDRLVIFGRSSPRPTRHMVGPPLGDVPMSFFHPSRLFPKMSVNADDGSPFGRVVFLRGVGLVVADYAVVDADLSLAGHGGTGLDIYDATVTAFIDNVLSADDISGYVVSVRAWHIPGPSALACLTLTLALCRKRGRRGTRRNKEEQEDRHL